jgi:hypothetical protein
MIASTILLIMVILLWPVFVGRIARQVLPAAHI